MKAEENGMNEKNKELELKEVIPYIAAIAIVLAAVVLLGLFLWRNRNEVVTENVVQRYLKDYYGEITVLSELWV